MFSKIRKKFSGDKGHEQNRERARSNSKCIAEYLQIPASVSSEDLLRVQQLLALQAKLDQEIVFENNCTFLGKNQYIVISKCSIRVYKSRKNWQSVKKRGSPELALLLHDCYAVVPDIPSKNTLLIRTTTSIFPTRLQNEDEVDSCIALINAQTISQANQQARIHFWKGKYTVHVFVSEIWDLPFFDAAPVVDPQIQIRILPKIDRAPTSRSEPKSRKGDDIVYSIRIRERERNPVFNDQYTFLCANGTDAIIFEISDTDQWGKKEITGIVRINLSEHLGPEGVHGWFSIKDANEQDGSGYGYMHIRIAIFDATESIDHISMAGYNFLSARHARLQTLSNIEPVVPLTQKIPVFVGTWNVGNECPPDDISPWIGLYNDTIAQVKAIPLTRLNSNGIDEERQLSKTSSFHKRSDSAVDETDMFGVMSFKQLAKMDSEESLASIGQDDADSKIELCSLNELKIRSRKPRIGVKSSRQLNRSNYDRSPVEIPSPPGLYIVGSQECQYTPKNGVSSNCKDDWIKMLSMHLGPDYIQADYSSLWQIRMAIFVRKDLISHISNMSVHKEATGIAHVLGNKGGVVVSFRLYQTSLCFINCHLAAHQTKRDQRNQDIRDIITKSASKVGNRQNDLASQFHCIWLLGDLNYRLDYGAQANLKSPPVQEFREIECLIQSGRFNVLFNFDQLLRDMQKEDILSGWEEGVYDFPPSFKVERNSGFKYNPIRSPAWCDRILWKSYRENSVEQTTMKICESIATSDHKPISSLFSVDVFFFEESRDFSRGRAELLFTEVMLTLTDPIANSNPVQYHLRFRSDCFAQNPIIQALIDKPVVPIIALDSKSTTETDSAFSNSSMDESWLNAPLFPVIKLKHNNLLRLKQHIISVELIHFTGTVFAQGNVHFHVFDVPGIQLSKPSLSARASGASASSAMLISPAQATESAMPSVSDTSGAALSPLNATGSMNSTPGSRRISQMVIRPSSGRESVRTSASVSEYASKQIPNALLLRELFSRSLARKSVFQIGMSQRSSVQRSTLASNENDKSRPASTQLEQFANLQNSVSFSCDLSLGTTSVGCLNGVMRLSWAS